MHHRRVSAPPLTRMIPQDMLYVVEIGILDSMNSSRVEVSVFGVQNAESEHLGSRLTCTIV